MALAFPANPSLNQIYTYDYSSWRWDGEAWQVYPVTTISIDDLFSINIDGGNF